MKQASAGTVAVAVAEVVVVVAVVVVVGAEYRLDIADTRVAGTVTVDLAVWVGQVEAEVETDSFEAEVDFFEDEVDSFEVEVVK